MTYRAEEKNYACAGCGATGKASEQIPVGMFDSKIRKHVMRWFCRQGTTIKPTCRALYNQKVEAA